MFSTPLPVLRRTICVYKFPNSSLPTTQGRHALILPTLLCFPSRSNRFILTSSTDAHARILEKYKAKLEEKMKSEGVTSHTDLRKIYQSQIDSLNNYSTLPSLPKVSLSDNFGHSPRPAPHYSTPIIPAPRSNSTSASPPPGVKTLSSYMDLPKLSALPPTEIEYLWRLRHSSSATSLCASIPKSTFQRLLHNAKRHPMFILPLPRPGGVIEMHFLQWTYPHKDVATILFTSLAAYKLHGEFAVPHTTLTHHLELMEEKGLVLAQGGVVNDRGVSVEEGRWLVMALQKFYGADEGEEEGRSRIELLEQFTQGGEGFKLKDVIAQAERLK